MSQLLLVFLAACLFNSGLAWAAESAYYREAKERYEKEEYLLAMLAAEKAVKEDGSNPSHRYLYGAVLAALKQFSDAEIHLRKAAGWEPQNAEYQFQLGMVLLEQSQDRVLRRGMSSGLRLSRSEGIDPEGVEALEKAVALDPGHLKARVRLGRVYFDLNRYEDTLDQFQAVAEQDPEYPMIHSHQAVVRLKTGQVSKAIVELQSEIGLNPGNAEARLDLGDLLLQLGQPKSALQQLLAAQKKNSTTPDLHYALAKTYLALGQNQKALVAVRHCLQLDPDSLAPRYLLAQLYRQTGQADLARQELAAAEKLREKRAETYQPPKAN